MVRERVTREVAGSGNASDVTLRTLGSSVRVTPDMHCSSIAVAFCIRTTRHAPRATHPAPRKMHLRQLLSIVAIAVLGAPAGAQIRQQGTPIPQNGFTFAGLAWGVKANTVRTMLEGAGYVYERTDGEGDLVFRGTSVGYPAIVYAMMSDGRLVKTDVILLPPSTRVRAVYGAMKETLAAKYGAGESIEFFRSPYREGDGNEELALRADKAKMLTHWSRGEDELLMHIAPVSDSLVVSIAYESPGWSEESRARRERATKLF